MSPPQWPTARARTKPQDTIRLRVADIPGLIDGAHRNRGLGHEFLRHVSRTRALMFVIDAAGSEGRDPVEDLASLKEELRLYDVELAGKPAFVVANKTDLRGRYSSTLRPTYRQNSRPATCAVCTMHAYIVAAFFFFVLFAYWVIGVSLWGHLLFFRMYVQ